MDQKLELLIESRARCPIAGVRIDLRITQIVNGVVGVHAALAHNALATATQE